MPATPSSRPSASPAPSASDPATTAVRIVFDLGPWVSPYQHGWQAAYDALVADVVAAGRRPYGVLSEGLAPTPWVDALTGGLRAARADEARDWIDAWVRHAADVVARYGDRVAVFEALPGMNAPVAASGEPRMHAGGGAYLLARMRAAWPAPDIGTAPRLVGGALVGGAGGRAAAIDYVRRVHRAGRTAYGWPDGMGAVDGWALHGDVSVDPAGDEPRALAGALGRRGGAAPLVYVSGFRAAGADARAPNARFPGAWFNRVARDPRIALAAGERLADGPVGPADAPAAAAGDAARLAAPDRTGDAHPIASTTRRGAPGARRAPLLAEDIGWNVVLVAAPRADRLPVATATADLAIAAGALREAVAEVPVVDGFDPPVGDRAASAWHAYKCDTVLCDEAYHADPQLRAWHPGEDWNGVGGGDTDLGDPIFAAGHGRVVAAGHFTPSWGNVVLVEHRLPDGTAIWSQYAHLDTVEVAEGDIVARGQRVGTLGKGANNVWKAHLHFEIRLTELPANNWRPMVDDRDQVLAHYAAPRGFIDARRPGMLATPAGPPIVVDTAGTDPSHGSFARTDVPNWFESPAGLHGGALFTFASAAVESNVGTWTAALPGERRYLVAAFVPGRDATTRNAVYGVSHVGGVAQVRVDQNRHSDVWVTLGQFTCRDVGTVRLSDVTGEGGGLRRRVCFDAVRWLPLA